MTEIKEKEEMRTDRFHFNFGRLFLGLIIVALGVLYFLRNFGVIDFALDWSRLWPLVIIFIGLSMLSGRSLIAAVIGVLAVFVVVAVIVSALVVGKDSTSTSQIAGVNSEEQNVSIGKSPDINRAEVEIKMGAGKLDISGGSDELVSGNFASQFLRLDTQNTISNDVQRVKIIGQGTSRPFGRQFNDLNLKLSSVVPMSLSLDTGAMDMTVDLSNVKAEKVDINTGASSLDLTMGADVSRARVAVKAGASSIDINIPESVGARVRIDSGLSSKNLENFRQIDSNTYETDNYASADKKIDFEFSIGASSLELSRK